MTFYLDEDTRKILHRLEEQVDAFGALATLVNHYASDVRHADDGLMRGIVGLVRAHAERVSSVVDDLRRIRQSWEQQASTVASWMLTQTTLPNQIEPPVRLSALLATVMGGNPGEVRALEFAEFEAHAALDEHTLLWMTEENVEERQDPMPRAVDALTDRIESGDGNTYQEHKAVLEACATMTSDRVADVAAQVYACQRRAAYYLGLARGWLAAWRIGGAR